MLVLVSDKCYLLSLLSGSGSTINLCLEARLVLISVLLYGCELSSEYREFYRYYLSWLPQDSGFRMANSRLDVSLNEMCGLTLIYLHPMQGLHMWAHLFPTSQGSVIIYIECNIFSNSRYTHFFHM